MVSLILRFDEQGLRFDETLWQRVYQTPWLSSIDAKRRYNSARSQNGVGKDLTAATENALMRLWEGNAKGRIVSSNSNLTDITQKNITYNHRITSDFDTRTDRKTLDDAVVVDENVFANLEREQNQTTNR